MKRHILESWILLVYFDGLMHLGGFKRTHAGVRTQKLRTRRTPHDPCTELCHAMDLACVFYFKRVHCLQRSAATAVLLRRHGWEAEMVIGAQLLPFQSHAWVEVDGEVVNDKPYVTEMFAVLERC